MIEYITVRYLRCPSCHTVGLFRKFPSMIPRIVFCINRTFRCLYVRLLVRSRFFLYGRKTRADDAAPVRELPYEYTVPHIRSVLYWLH